MGINFLYPEYEVVRIWTDALSAGFAKDSAPMRFTATTRRKK